VVQTCRAVGQVLLLLCAKTCENGEDGVVYLYCIHIYIFYGESGAEDCVSMV